MAGRRPIKLEQDDLVVLYSDGASEALNDIGTELGREGLMSLATETAVHSAPTFGAGLSEALRSFRGGDLVQDDQTVIVLRAL